MTVAEVLHFFLVAPDKPRYGAQILRTTGQKSGTLYPILSRLEKVGWITSTWEDIDPVQAGRPARRLYTFAPGGAEAARAELIRLSDAYRPPS
jgi:DNA-binding PadR family transcriptional regulator